jgi:hypothetical protein
MPTMYTSFDAAKAALEINGGFIIETSVDREFWLAADYIEAVQILVWAGGSREQAFAWLVAHPNFTNGSLVSAVDYAASL